MAVDASSTSLRDLDALSSPVSLVYLSSSHLVVVVVVVVVVVSVAQTAMIRSVILIITNQSSYNACVDLESVVRGGSTVTTISSIFTNTFSQLMMAERIQIPL